MIRTVIFDLDGTLLNTLDDLAGSVNFALDRNGFPTRSLKEVRSFLGNGIGFLIRHAMPEEVSEEAFEKTLADFRGHYMKHCLDKTRPYEGMMDVLAELKKEGYSMAIVSNKLQPAVEELNSRFFSAFVQVAIGESREVRRKPAPDSVFTALRLLHAKAEEAVYVGDSEVDMETAVNAGLPCISVLWGFRDADFLKEHKARLFAALPEELPAVIRSIE